MHLSHHISHPYIHIYLSTFRSIHPQPYAQAFTCHFSINPSIYLFSHIASFPHTSVWKVNALSLWNDRSPTLFLFWHMDITDPSGFPCLSNHPLIYHSSFFLTFFYNAPLHLRWNNKALTPSVYQRPSYHGPHHTIALLLVLYSSVFLSLYAKSL